MLKTRFVRVSAMLLLVAGLVGIVAAQEVSGDLEVFSWWTSGGEAAALDALFETYSASNPDVNIVNATVAGGGGSAARGILQTRLAGGDPPDTWQVHPGFELLDQYVATGFVEPLNALYDEEGWWDVVPEALTDMMSDADGNIYQVTVGVHRGNGFWYNVGVLEDNGIDLAIIEDGLTNDEFFEIADTLQAAGVDALCVGDSGIWASSQLLENTLLGVLGPEAYLSLWNGELAFDAPEVQEAMAVYGRMLDYQNADHAALSWDQAVAKVIDGDCAFNSMGDWAYGEIVNAISSGTIEEGAVGWTNHPGTAGAFMIVADGFVQANGAPNAAANTEWLRSIGSVEAQEAFNPLKGSICARTDCDRASFGEYHNWSMDSFSADVLVPTVVHGSAAPADFQQALNDAVTFFVSSAREEADVEGLALSLVDAVGMASSGFGQ